MFLLVLVMFTGEVSTNLYPNMADCEAALIQKTDVGNFKKIKIAECIDVEKAKEE
jgi:hypothetical protein